MKSVTWPVDLFSLQLNRILFFVFLKCSSWRKPVPLISRRLWSNFVLKVLRLKWLSKLKRSRQSIKTEIHSLPSKHLGKKEILRHHEVQNQRTSEVDFDHIFLKKYCRLVLNIRLQVSSYSYNQSLSIPSLD